MTRSTLSRASMLAVGVIGATLLSGCIERRPALLEGDANSLVIRYAGAVADTLARARQHCAQFERVPRLAATKDEDEDDTVRYDCVRP